MNAATAFAMDAALTPADQASLIVLSGIVDRLGVVIDTETEALRHQQPIDLAVVNQSKRQGLLELSRLAPMLSATLLHGEGRVRLENLSQKLERNRQVLDVQVRAVREVSDIIARTLREAESDGTYSGHAGRS